MSLNNLPKELTLINPANYDEFKFRNHLSAVLSLTTFHSLYEKESMLFNTFFQTKEHKDLAYQIIRFIIDKEPNQTTGVLLRRFVVSLYEAGYFG